MDIDRDPDLNPFDSTKKKPRLILYVYRLLLSRGQINPFYYKRCNLINPCQKYLLLRSRSNSEIDLDLDSVLTLIGIRIWIQNGIQP